jgi:hypothetical protein
MLHSRELANEEVDSPDRTGIFDRQLKVENGEMEEATKPS